MRRYFRPCKDCGVKFEVSEMKTFFICSKCKEIRKKLDIEKKSKNICKKCGNEFIKSPSLRRYMGL